MGISAFGTLLQIGDGGGSEVFTTIAEVRDIGGPNLSLDTDESTHHGSTGGWAEFVATIKRGGDVTFEVNYLPANATHDASTGLIKDFNDKTLRNFKLIFPDTGATTWQFAAFVTGVGPSEPVAGKLSASIALTISGQPTLA